MYIKYKIIKLEKKGTKIGEIIKADLQNLDGVVETGVAIFNSFPNFSSLGVGSEVIGMITVKVNGQFTNKTLNEERTQGWGGGKKGPSINMNKLMEKKAEYIQEAQERKNESIAYFNAVNSAINAMGKYPYGSMGDLEKGWKVHFIELRDWFLSEWQKYESDPTKGKQPW